MTERYAKIALLAAVALYVSLAAFNNITDYGSNFAFVSHVLMMDTTFEGNAGMWRAITQDWVHHAAYVAIIACESLVAVLCWVGCMRLWRARGDVMAFQQAKAIATAALTLGVFLWFAGFVAIGGEWFMMWQSSIWNGVATSFNIATFLMLVLLYMARQEQTD